MLKGLFGKVLKFKNEIDKKKKKIKNRKIRRDVLSFTLSFFVIDSELRQKQDGRHSTALPSKIFPKLNDLGNVYIQP